MECVATCPAGFERALGRELEALGAGQVRPLKGQVSFQGELADAYRACLWSRLASRVLVVLARVGASGSDELYEGVAALPWEDHLPPGASLAVDAHGTNKALRTTQFVALRAKDAIADRLRARRGAAPRTDPAHPDLTVAVRLSGERAMVAVDLAGEPLFRRGYDSRSQARAAALRPDYAALLLQAGGWDAACGGAPAGHPAGKKGAGDGAAPAAGKKGAAPAGPAAPGAPTLVALWPGQGSVLVEAAGMACDRAPGLLRARWGFSRWAGHDEGAWQALLDEADARAEEGAARMPRLVAADPRPGTGAACRQALRAAGLPCEPELVQPGEALDIARGLLAAGGGAGDKGTAPAAVPGLLVTCDLSWLGPDDLPEEASALACLQGAAGLPAAVLARDASADAALRAEPAGTAELIVGRDPACIRAYAPSADLAPAPTVAVGTGRERVPVLVAASDQFAARLAKVAKRRAKWARRELVSCYRVYDADLPDYAVAIERYGGCEPADPGPWLLVSEYAAPKGVDPELARRRLLDVLAVAPAVLDVDPAHVSLRVRTRSRGGSQYADEARGGASLATERPGRATGHADGRADSRAAHDPRDRASAAGARASAAPALPPGAHLVDEGGLTFEVNFDARHDCGLFLDHRETRALLREMMKETQGSRRFLNLFAYTGTATCYAADGGARHTTTVDLSLPTLDWARRNMARNGFDGPEHEYVQADAIAWVGEQRHTANRWDLVFCDVPTFSNSARMRGGSFDVQRDHVELLIGVSRLLTRAGRAVFSCNLRTFRPDVEALAKAGVELEDITARTIPEDFSRTPKVHHCYVVRRIPRP